MNWKAVIEKLMAIDATKPSMHRNPWIGRIELYDLVAALKAGLPRDFKWPEDYPGPR